METREARSEPGLVQSLIRALSLLEILSEDPEGCRLKELSHRAGLSPSTTHRLLTTLEQKRFVQFDREGCLWNVGINCFTTGAGFLRRQSFVTESEPRMRELIGRVGDTATLGVLNDGKLVVLSQTRAGGTRHGGAAIGQLSLHSSALGKMLLAMHTAHHDHPLFSAGSSRRQPLARQVGDPAAFTRELADIRREGHAVDDGNADPARRCVAAPLFDEFGHPVAAISVSAMRTRLSDAELPKVTALVVATAREITLASGGFNPDERASPATRHSLGP